MNWQTLLLLLGSIAGFLLPLTWSLRELFRPQDLSPLVIDPLYRKDDRFFPLLFKARLVRLGVAPRPGGWVELNEPTPYKVYTTLADLTLSSGVADADAIDVNGSFRTTPGVVLDHDIHASGKSFVEKQTTLRALACEQDVKFASGVVIRAWVDTNRTLTVSAGCTLGFKATAGERIVLDSTVSFRLLSAPVISWSAREALSVPVYDASRQTTELSFIDAESRRTLDDNTVIILGDFHGPPGAVFLHSLIVHGSTHLGEGSIVKGSIKGHQEVTIGPHARVFGSVVSSTTIRLAEASYVSEHLVADGNILLEKDAMVGTPGRITTVLGYDQIKLCRDTTIFGRVLAIHAGVTE